LAYLDKVKTPSQLRRVKELIDRFSSCYQGWHERMAQIAAEAKAGNWMPGKRIAEGDKDSAEDAWQTP